MTDLRKQPDARFISVSINDGHEYCQRDADRAIIEEEGSPSGPIVRAVNQIAAAVEVEFPLVAVEMLAYDYALLAPQKTRARHNVRVQWRNADNEAEAITHPGNVEWRKAFEGWANITDQMTIMQMTANGGSFVMPTPNWLALPKDIQYFRQHSVRGFFAWAPAYYPTLAMSELRAYVTASMLWNVSRNATEEVSEFVTAYYGDKADTYVWRHMDAWHLALSKLNMTKGTQECRSVDVVAGNCTSNSLFRYGGFSDCGSACTNGKLHCDTPGCFCVSAYYLARILRVGLELSMVARP